MVWSFQCSLPNFIFYLWFVLTYPIDLIRLDFAVNGGGVKIIEGPLLYEILNFFYITFLPILKIYLSIAWVVKIFEGPVGGGLFICGTYSHILFTYSDFIFLSYLPILKASCVQLQ